MKNEMRLQGIGLVEGTPAGELKVGDIIRWNYGSIGRVISAQLSVTGKTIEVTTEYYHNGKTDTYTWKRRSSSLVNIIGGGDTVLTGEYTFENVTEVEEVIEVTLYTDVYGEEAIEKGENFCATNEQDAVHYHKVVVKSDSIAPCRQSEKLVVVLFSGVVTQEEATEKSNEWVWTTKTENMKPDRKAGESVPTEYMREGVNEFTPPKSWIEKGYVEKKTDKSRKRTAVRKYNCECGCKREIGKGTDYYQVGPKGTNYKLVHHECIGKVKQTS